MQDSGVGSSSFVGQDILAAEQAKCEHEQYDNQ